MEAEAVTLAPPAAVAGRPAAGVWRLDWLTPRVCRLLFATILAFGFYSHVRYLTHDCPVDLSGDEAHYWDWSRQLDWSYYSKGPLVAYIIRAGCWAFGQDTMPVVRFPAVLLGVGTSVLTYLLALKLFRSDRVALGTVLLYHVVPMFVAGSVLMTIDPPFFFCWALATYLLALAVFDHRRWAWPLIGVAVGVGFLAKYAAFAWFIPMLLFLAADREARKFLRSPWPWVAIGVATLFLTPVIVWNANHGWVSLRHVTKQTGTTAEGGFDPAHLGEFVGGQIGIIGPGLFVLMVAGVLYAISPSVPARVGPPGRQRKPRFRPRMRADGPEPYVRQMRFLAWFGVVFFGFTLLMTFRTKVQPNWPAPAYFTLMILAAYFIATRLRDRRTWRGWRWWFFPAVFFGLLMMPLAHDMETVYPAVRWFNAKMAAWRERPDNGVRAWIGRRLPADGIDARTIDVAARAKGWEELGKVLSAELADDVPPKPFGNPRTPLGPDAFILCEDYQQTAQTAFYVKGQPKTYYAGSYQREDPKRHTQYDLWPDRSLVPPNPLIGKNAIFLGHSFRPPGDIVAAFERVEGDYLTVKRSKRAWLWPLLTVEHRSINVEITREGLPVRTFRYFRCYGFKGMQRPKEKDY